MTVEKHTGKVTKFFVSLTAFLIITATACAFVFSLYSAAYLTSRCEVNIDTGSKEERLVRAIEQLPDCALKSNCYVVLAAEYGKDSDELNELLNAYAEMKLKELKAAQ
jgi:hypothetical protein